MPNTNVCLQVDCEEPPVVEVVIVYPETSVRECKESRVRYCLDHIGERAQRCLQEGAISVAILRLDR